MASKPCRAGRSLLQGFQLLIPAGYEISCISCSTGTALRARILRSSREKHYNVESVLWCYESTGDRKMLEFAENAWLCYEREAAANSAVSCDCCGSTSWRTAQPAMSKLGACVVLRLPRAARVV